jgi:hypothetical protein
MVRPRKLPKRCWTRCCNHSGKPQKNCEHYTSHTIGTSFYSKSTILAFLTKNSERCIF